MDEPIPINRAHQRRVAAATARNLELATGMRAAMSAFVNAAGTRRVLPTIFHVGRPGGRADERWAIVDDPSQDAGLRIDLVEYAVEAAGLANPVPWMTRSGDLSPHDADLAWFAATRLAFERLELDLPGFFVVTRKGWMNLLTEDVQVQRIRARRRRQA